MLDLTLLVLMELLILAFAVEMLVGGGMPQDLQQLAAENCQRLDGSPSGRRIRKEHRARTKLRTDLWAGFLLAALAANGLLIAIHSFVVPLDMATRIVLTILPEPDAARDRLRAQGHDEAYVSWVRQTRRVSNSEARETGRRLWAFWPAMAALVLALAVAIGYAMKYALKRAFRDYAAGLEYRHQQNLYVDLARFEDGIEPERRR